MPPRKKKPKVDPYQVLADQGPQPVYVLDGEERVLVDEFVAAVRDAAVPPHARDFNVDQFSGRDASIARVIDAAQTFPAFAQRRLVICQHADKLDFDKNLDAFLAYLKDPSPTTTVLFVADKFDGRGKAYKAAAKAKVTVRFSSPNAREMPDVVRARARKMKIDVDARAVRAIVDAVGTDVGAASQALEVLSLYVGEPARKITADDVAAVVAVTKEENIFKLVDAIGTGNRAAVLEGLHGILGVARDHPLRLLALVARHYRNLTKARAALDAGVSRGEIQAMVGVPPFVMDNLLSQARRHDLKTLARGLAAVTATDRDLKGGALDNTRAMERLVFRLMAS
ncbi:MAG: DNA polymerase III subunit delta [Deltaproteobacteria bacterium]|jgi:DNA polymerase-3 subunit delta